VASWFGGQRAIVLAVQRQPGTNTVAVANAVLALMDRLRPQLPASVEVATLYDRSESIRASVSDVRFTLLLTLAAGGAGDLPVPAQPARHDHPQRGAAAVDSSARSRS